MPTVVVHPYDPRWPELFVRLQERIWPAVAEFALSIEHVGSTSVPGLAAKPIIDLDLVIPDRTFLDRAIWSLATLGYDHLGNLGIEDRDAFKPTSIDIRHNLYVCPADSVSLRNHLCLRDTLRARVDLRKEYAALKYALAGQFPDSIEDYVEGKTAFVLTVLESHGFGPDSLERIKLTNIKPPKANRRPD